MAVHDDVAPAAIAPGTAPDISSSGSSATAHEPTSPVADSLSKLPAESQGPDLSKPKTLVHRLTFGVIADPWIKKPWGVRVSADPAPFHGDDP